MKRFTRTRKLAFAAGVASLAIVAFGPAQSALASGKLVQINAAAFSGTTASPTITLTGTGFGTKPVQRCRRFEPEKLPRRPLFRDRLPGC
jgi:hypothetical protein